MGSDKGTVKIKTEVLNRTRLAALYRNYRDTIGRAQEATGTRFVGGVGYANPRLVFVGEAPGKEETLAGVPFVGRTGELLDAMLVEIGVDLSRVYYTNLLKYRPKNRDPLPDEVLTNLGFMRLELGILDPLIVVPLGRYSACLYFQNFSISSINGQMYIKDGRVVIPMFHPSFILRNQHTQRTLMEQYRDGFQVLKQVMANPAVALTGGSQPLSRTVSAKPIPPTSTQLGSGVRRLKRVVTNKPTNQKLVGS